MASKQTSIPVEVSARHVHLTEPDVMALFGVDHLTVAREISQKPQFSAVERVTLRGPKGEIKNVAIVGPCRPYTQVELAMTDARALGLQPPLSDSGVLDQAAEVTIIGPKGEVSRQAAIIQKRHLHMTPAEAAKRKLEKNQSVSLLIGGPRGVRLDHVLVRVHTSFTLRLHLDTDEANACGYTPGMKAEIVSHG